MKHPDATTVIQVPEEFKPLLEDIRDLTKDGHNPNKMTKSRREALWRSLKKFGWFKPILVDGEGLLGDGEQRLEACLAMEIDPRYVQIAMDRWAHYTGQTPEKL